MPNYKRIRKIALKDNIQRLIPVLSATKAGQGMTNNQIKAGAKQMAVRWMSARRKQLLEEARTKEPSMDVQIFLKEMEINASKRSLPAND